MTLSDKTVYKLDADGAITVAIANGKPLYGIQTDIVIKDAEGNIVWQTHVTFSSRSLTQVLSKFTSTIANLPATPL
jgi:hypothetical protein